MEHPCQWYLLFYAESSFLRVPEGVLNPGYGPWYNHGQPNAKYLGGNFYLFLPRQLNSKSEAVHMMHNEQEPVNESEAVHHNNTRAKQLYTNVSQV